MAGLAKAVETTVQENPKVTPGQEQEVNNNVKIIESAVEAKEKQLDQVKVGCEDGAKVKDESTVAAKEDEKDKAVVKEEKVEANKDEGGILEKEKEKEKEEENVKMEVEAKTGVSFPVKLPDGKELNSLGLRRKKVIALNINIYAFGMYADNAKLKVLLKEKFGKAPAKATKEIYEAVIDSDIGMVVRLVIVFGGLSMSMVRKNFNEGLGASLKKLNGGKKNEEISNKVMGAAKDSIKLSSGSVIEMTKRPGYILQTKVKGEVLSKVESELLCRAYFHMYLGDDPFDKEAKEKFGNSLLSLF